MRAGRCRPACAGARLRWQATAHWGGILAYARGGGNGVMRRAGAPPGASVRRDARVSSCRLASLFTRPGTHDEKAESAWFGLTDLGADYGAVLVRMSLDGTPVDLMNKLVDIVSVG